MAKVIILSGAGISAESGISTFRDTNGLYYGKTIILKIYVVLIV